MPSIALGRLGADTGFLKPAGRAIKIDRIVSKVRSFRQEFAPADRYNYYIPGMYAAVLNDIGLSPAAHTSGSLVRSGVPGGGLC